MRVFEWQGGDSLLGGNGRDVAPWGPSEMDRPGSEGIEAVVEQHHHVRKAADTEASDACHRDHGHQCEEQDSPITLRFIRACANSAVGTDEGQRDDQEHGQ